MFIEGLNIVIGSWNSIAEELEIVRENETVFCQNYQNDEQCDHHCT